MNDHPAIVTAKQLEQIMAEIQHFIDHPRIQQRRWVEKGRTWLPLLQQARAHLLTHVAGHTHQPASPPPAPAKPAQVGLEVRPRDSVTWGYSWDGVPLKGNYPSLVQALEAALRERSSEQRS